MQYIVTCWVNPTTGYDLIQRLQVHGFINTLRKVFDPAGKADPVFEGSEEDHKGMILKDFTIELNYIPTDAALDLMPTVWEQYPEAELSHWGACHVTGEAYKLGAA